MSEKAGELYYEVDIETAKMIAASRKASDVLDAMGKGARNASGGVDKLEQSGNRAASSMGTLKSALSGVASAISVALIIEYGKAFLEVADNVTMLQARISRLSSGSIEARNTFSSLSQIASNTGSSLQETQGLWEKLTSSLKGAGATNQQILFLTDTLQKIGRLGGSSAEEMANGLRQFGQSLDRGTVQAEEFNSIVESIPELARQMAAGMGISMAQLRQAMLDGKITAQAALEAIAKQSDTVNQEFNKLPRSMEQASNSLTVSLSLLVGSMNEATGASQTMVTIIDSISAAIDRLSGRAETAAQKIADLTSTGEMYSRRARTWSFLGLDGWAQQNTALSVLSNRAATLVGDLDAVGKASENAANKGKGFGGGNVANPKQDNLVKTSERRLALAKLEGEARARLQAQYDAADAGITDQKRVKALQDEYAETYRVTAARKESNAQSKSSASASDAAASALDRQSGAIARLNTGYADGSLELAKYDAVKALGSQATQQQIAEAERNAEAEWKLQRAKEAVAQADRDKQSAQSNFTSLKGQASPVAGVDNQFQQQMEQLNQYATLYPQKIAEVEAVRASIEEQYRQKRTEAMWQEWSQQNAATQAAAAAFDAFGNQASNALTGIITGSMSASDAVASIGRTVLNDVIDTFVQMGVEQAKAAIMGGSVQQAQIAATTAAQVGGLATSTAASTASASTTMAAWLPAALVASVGSFGAAAIVGGAALVGAFALSKTLGGRKNGGPVDSGNVYPVGEGNLPEFMQTNKGLFMIPGDKGRVFSNKDVTGSPIIPRASTGKEHLTNSVSNQQMAGNGQRQMQVNIQFFDQTSGGSHTLQTETSMDNGIAEVKAYLLDDQANNGEITRGYAAALGQRVVARGAY